MGKKINILKKISLTIFFTLLAADFCFAITLLTEDEALLRLLPQNDEIETRKITVSPEQLEIIKKNLGGKLVYEVKNQYDEELNRQNEFTFYFAKNQSQTAAVALILDEPGKWGPIKFFICLNPQGQIENTAVMKYTETRGRPIASRSFLRQFFKKTLNDPISLGNDIQGVTSATISSRAACFTMKKAMVLYKILLLNKG